MKNNIRFMYVRDSKYEPCGCLAIRVIRSANKVEYGLSVRNPLDAVDLDGHRVRFNRKMAQAKALERLAYNPHCAYISKDASQHDISRAVLQSVVVNPDAPNRAKRYAKNWLRCMESVFGQSFDMANTKLPYFQLPTYE